jgi:microcystin-dependent protein
MGGIKMADKKLSAYDVLSEMSGEDLIVALKSLGEGKYQNANVKLIGIAEALSKLSERGLAKTDLSNLSEKGKSAIKESAPGLPAGSIICFAGTKGTRFDNGGYFYCDGRAVSRGEYPDLFDAIGETYGKGDGVNTFNVPDFRGCFLRGCGGNSAPLGQQQGDAIRNIVGDFSINLSAGIVNGPFAYTGNTTKAYAATSKPSWQAPSFDASRVVPVANENRPVNYAVHYYIKC